MERDFELAEEKVKKDLNRFIALERWEEVVKVYSKSPQAHTCTVNYERATALHVAVSFGKEDVVRKLLNAIITNTTIESSSTRPPQLRALKIEDENGNTPLHRAASNGFTKICRLIIGEESDRSYLLRLKNKDGRTPLFLTVIAGQKLTFAYLFSEVDSCADASQNDFIDNVGRSILDFAIVVEHFDLALLILFRKNFLRTHASQDRSEPLDKLAKMPSAFRSGSSLSWWSRILYHCIVVEPVEEEREEHFLKFCSRLLIRTAALCGQRIRAWYYWHVRENLPCNAQNNCILSSENSPIGFLGSIYATFKRYTYATFQLAYAYTFGLLVAGKRFCAHIKWILSSENSPIGFLGSIYATFKRYTYATFQLAYAYTFGLLVADLTEVKKTKEKHQWSGQLMKALMRNPNNILNNPKDEFINSTALYAATSNGITEMVIETLSPLPDTEIVKNVLREAVANRQPLVVKVLRKKLQSKPELWNQLFEAVNSDGNTILHLAARAPASDKPWQIAGSSALQMMWDLKWYQYVKSLVQQSSPWQLFEVNKDNKTARELFADEHKDLIEKSSEWLKSTSQSCSVVAALVVGVSFATASTVPGGNNDKGKPALEGEPVFNAFAIASLVGFYSSVTALILFLSMMTSRNQAKDFRRDLPLKLLLGLSFLFVSIVAILVSFSTGHFFLLHNEYKTAQLLPIYGASSLLVIFVVAQFQLFFDLLTTILTEVPRRPTDRFANL